LPQFYQTYEQNQCRGEPCVRPSNKNQYQTYEQNQCRGEPCVRPRTKTSIKRKKKDVVRGIEEKEKENVINENVVKKEIKVRMVMKKFE